MRLNFSVYVSSHRKLRQEELAWSVLPQRLTTNTKCTRAKGVSSSDDQASSDWLQSSQREIKKESGKNDD
jgi:hypothetical protein